MVYRAIGIMSGSSLDGLDIAFTELDDSGGTWKCEVRATACVEYDEYWLAKLQGAKLLNAFDYFALHAKYGRYIGNAINNFIHEHHLHHQVQLIASHGHTVFHSPDKGFTAQLGDGATIAAITGINVVSGLRDMDVALGGQGAPIVPMGEKLLWKDYDYFLNIGGIANISHRNAENFTAFDVCPANRVLNMLAGLKNKPYDENGGMAANGTVNPNLLDALNNLDYYSLPYPKSLANEFGTNVVFPLIEDHHLAVEDALCTYVEHIAGQVGKAASLIAEHIQTAESSVIKKMLVTGGGAFNNFLINKLKQMVTRLNIEVEIPARETIQYKEAIIMALLGILRWREENTVFSSVTGAKRSSIGGAVWMGQEA